LPRRHTYFCCRHALRRAPLSPAAMPTIVEMRHAMPDADAYRHAIVAAYALSMMLR